MGEMKLGDLTIKLFGHSSVGIFGAKVIYIDPYILPHNPDKADIILSTHEHFDHCAPDVIKQIRKEETQLVVHPNCALRFSGAVKTLKPGEKTDLDGIEIKGIFSYNIGKQFHPKGSVTGFIVKIDGKKIYHPGDTDFIPEMKELAKEKIDVAFFPVGGTYTMTADEAAEAAKAVKPKIAVPMHYGSVVGSARDAEKFKKLLDGSGIDVKILN
jgi:L-ascorbate metabolism protein UlaG (beta-lactamase superfamily)